MSYRIFEKNSDSPLTIFGCVLDSPTLQKAEEVEEDIFYTLEKFTDVELDRLEIWKVDGMGNKLEKV